MKLNCTDLEILLCDYVDGTLDAAARAAVEAHLSGCAGCAGLARDAAGAVEFMGRAAAVEPPPELVTRILHQIPAAGPAPRTKAGFARLVSRWFQPVFQPRLVMGMAMTILSFAMLGRFAGIEARQLRAADLEPAKVWMALDDRVHRTWERAVKYYQSLRLVYEIQSQLREWNEQEEAEQSAPASSDAQAPADATAGQDQDKE